MDPIRPELYEIMNRLGGVLGEAFKAKGNYGFALLVFDMPPRGDGYKRGFMNWISNADRTDMIAALHEMVAVLEGRAHNEPERNQ